MGNVLADMNDIQAKITWFAVNKLLFNNTKTDNDILFETSIWGKFVKWEIWLNENKNSAVKTRTKLSRTTFLIRKMVNEVSFHKTKVVYFSLLQSVFSYNIWRHSIHLKNIFANRRGIVRIMTRLGYQEDIRSKFKELSIITVPSLYIRGMFLKYILFWNKQRFNNFIFILNPILIFIFLQNYHQYWTTFYSVQ